MPGLHFGGPGVSLASPWGLSGASLEESQFLSRIKIAIQFSSQQFGFEFRIRVCQLSFCFRPAL